MAILKEKHNLWQGGMNIPLAINYGDPLIAYLQAKYSGKGFLPENFSEVMLLMYLSFYKAFLFSSQGKFPVLKRVMLFLFRQFSRQSWHFMIWRVYCLFYFFSSFNALSYCQHVLKLPMANGVIKSLLLTIYYLQLQEFNSSHQNKVIVLVNPLYPQIFFLAIYSYSGIKKVV